MSRRRGSATALKLSEVVAARDMSESYADMGICQWVESGLTQVGSTTPIDRGALMELALYAGRASTRFATFRRPENSEPRLVRETAPQLSAYALGEQHGSCMRATEAIVQ